MDLIAGLNPTILVAAIGGVVAVIAIGFGARAAFGGRRDEVIERLERTTSGLDMGGLEERERPERGIARLAAILRPLARLVKPAPGEELSRINLSLVHAGYR